MPVLQWGMLCVLSLLLSIGFLALHLPAALLLGPMIAGIIFSMRGVTLQLPRSAFLAAQAILGCMIAQNLTGSILTTLAVNWPIVLAILLVTLLSSAIVGWLLVRYSSLPGNTGAWGSSPGGAAAMVAMAQDYGADIRLVAFMQYLRVLFVAGAAVLVTRMMLGDNAEAVNQQIVWFPPVSINLLLTIMLAVVAGTAGCLLRLPSGTMLIPMVPYGVSRTDCRIDYDELRKTAHECKPKLIVAGASAYPRTIDFARFREIADEVGAILMVDMAHIAGLVAAGLHPNPVPYADVVTSTTHKTLRGPRGGLILCKEKWAKQIDKAVFPGMQGGPLMHIIAAKAVSFKEALSDEFKAYQKQVVANAQALAESLTENGVKLVSGGTDNHLMLVDLTDDGISGKQLEKLLDEVHITANKNGIPFDTASPFITSGLRLGTPSVTTRGMKEPEMKIIGEVIADVIKRREEALADSTKKVLALTERFPLYKNDIIE